MEIFVAGRLDDARFYESKALAEALAEEFGHITSSCESMLEVDWNEFVRAKSREIGGAASGHKTSPIVWCNGTEYIGNEADFREHARSTLGFEPADTPVTHKTRARQAWRRWLRESRNDFVYMDFQQGDRSLGRVVFELYSQRCPKTCENFRALCTGERGTSKVGGVTLSYKGTLVHRVVRGGWIQGGDVTGKRGDGGESVYGPRFADENFSVTHDRPGVLAMASSGRHSNASQWYVTTRALPFLDKRCVAFGRVVSGMRAVSLVEQSQCSNQRPDEEIFVRKAGTFLCSGAPSPPLPADPGSETRATVSALFKHVFDRAAGAPSVRTRTRCGGSGRLEHALLQEQLDLGKAEGGELARTFPGSAGAIADAVRQHCEALRSAPRPRKLLSWGELAVIGSRVIAGTWDAEAAADSVARAARDVVEGDGGDDEADGASDAGGDEEKKDAR
jgi:peptidyl-prolyl cis-trans isomerase-like 6